MYLWGGGGYGGDHLRKEGNLVNCSRVSYNRETRDERHPWLLLRTCRTILGGEGHISYCTCEYQNINKRKTIYEIISNSEETKQPEDEGSHK